MLGALPPPTGLEYYWTGLEYEQQIKEIKQNAYILNINCVSLKNFIINGYFACIFT